MKRFLVSLCSLLLFTTFRTDAQGILRFEEVSPAPYNLSESFTSYRILALTDSIGTLADGEAITIRTGDGDFGFTLQDSKLFAPNHTVSVRGPHGVERRGLQEIGFDGAYFTNAALSASEALVLSVFENKYFVFLKQGSAEWYAEPLSAYIPSAPQHLYVQYRAGDVVAVDAHCGNAPISSGLQQGNPPMGGPEAGACFSTELAIGCDYSLFQEYGSIAATINRTATITNLTRADYKIINGLQDDIGFKIVEHYIATCDTCNPWTVTSTIGTNLTNVRLNGPTLFLNTYDLAQWWFNDPAFGSGTVGLAYVGAVCGSFRYNAMMDFTANTNSMRCTNSHEIGHNFDCAHDASGSTTIMAPSVSGSTTWSALSVSEIGAFAPTAACLSACPTAVAPCDTQGVHNLTIRKDTVASAVVVKWLAPAGASFRARLYNFSTASWTAFTTVAAPVDSIVFSIPATQCAGKFKVDIMPACTGPVYGGRKQVVFNWSRSIPLAASISANPVGAVCAGTPVTFTASTNATTGTSYQWKLNGANVGTNSPSYTAAAASGAVVNVVFTLAGASCFIGSPATSNSITMTTTATAVVPSVSIAASPAGTVCAAQTVTFTATPTNGGTTPQYQWKKNGVNAGPNSATFAASGWNNGDVITVVLTSSAPCASPVTSTSNAITMPVGLGTAPAVSIAASPAGTVCANATVTFTATPANAGATPAYQWRKGGVPVGANSAVYAATGFATGDVITCRVTSSALCTSGDTATSSGITMSVTQPTTPVISATGPAAAVCGGTSYSLAVSPAIAGATYQWFAGGIAVASGAAISLTNPAGAYTHYAVATLPANGCYTTPTVTSNTVTATVVVPTTPTVSVAASATTVCAGTPVAFTASTAVSGASYQWKVNGANAGTNAPAFSYTPANGDAVTCVVTVPSGACYTATSATSNAVTTTVTPLVIPTATLTGDTVLCGSQTRTYMATTTIAAAAWNWMLNGAPVAASGNTFTYAPATGDVLTATAASTGTGCYSPSAAAASRSMDVAIPQAYSISISPNITAGPGASTTVTYTAAVAGVMPYVIRWYNFGVHVFSSTIPQWTHVIPAGGLDSVWAWISPVGQVGCFAADSVQSNVMLVNSVPTGLAAAPVSGGGLSVYPNPVRETIFISGLRIGDEIQVLSNLGQMVARRVVTAASEEIDVRRWAAGVYVVQVGDVAVRVVRE